MKKTILITGANGNLGKAVVNLLHEQGYTICAVVGRSVLPEDFKEKVSDIRSVNLMDEKETENYIQEITRLYPDISAALLLAGGYATGDIAATDESALDQQISLNFKTAYFTARPLLHFFEKNGGGRFIFVGARPALSPVAGKGAIAYSLAKSMIFHLAGLINATGKGKRIAAHTIVPSLIDTPPNRKAMPEADFSKWVIPEDIAAAISFLLTDSAAALREGVLKLYNEA